ncbi:MAG: histidine kinase, partial [Elusimicrobia bacterium]|nr:histidine kinase [Elusimicrobiota bacterium]
MKGEQGHVYRELGREILLILNEPGGLRESLERVIAAIRDGTGFDAVGVRLREGEDYPYAAQLGLSCEFLSKENSLLERVRGGKPRLACTCGLVLSAGAAPANPFLTPGGSFWTNDSAPLLKLPPAKDPRFKPRNRCIRDGYASVALVPIRAKDEIVGLLHLNDRRKK